MTKATKNLFGELLADSLDMDLRLWYNNYMGQWRWTLTHNFDSRQMESGTSQDLEVALADVRRTIEWLMGTHRE